MCTLTVFKLPDTRWVVTMNRDEALTRDEGLPVTRQTAGKNSHWRPVDKQAGGSWFGAAHGRVFALLNRYQDKNDTQKEGVTLESRGRLIEELLSCDSQALLEQALASFKTRHFAPFDLFWFDTPAPQEPTKPQAHNAAPVAHPDNTAPVGAVMHQLAWTGQQWCRTHQAITDSFFHTSSSVDYAQAYAQRLGQFNALPKPATAASVLQLHKTRCLQNPSWGMNMQRSGRHTKSICQAVLCSSQTVIEYFGGSAFQAIGQPFVIE